MGCFPLLRRTPLMHIYVLSKNMVPDKEENYSVNIGGRMGGAECWDQEEYQVKTESQDPRG